MNSKSTFYRDLKLGDTSFTFLDSFIIKARHNEAFKPCLDQLVELSSQNQVKPSIFNQGYSFYANKTLLGVDKASTVHVIENAQAHMNNVCTKIISISSRESGTLPKIRLSDIQTPPMAPSNVPKTVVEYFSEEVKEGILGLHFNNKMVEDSVTSFKAGSTQYITEDDIGKGYMYNAKPQTHPNFNSAVEKFSEHLQDSSSIDGLINCSLQCEFLTCGMLDIFIGGFIGYGLYVSFYGLLHQPGNCTTFLKAVKQKLSPLDLENNSNQILDCYSEDNFKINKVKVSYVNPLKDFIPKVTVRLWAYIPQYIPQVETTWITDAGNLFITIINLPARR